MSLMTLGFFQCAFSCFFHYKDFINKDMYICLELLCSLTLDVLLKTNFFTICLFL